MCAANTGPSVCDHQGEDHEMKAVEFETTIAQNGQSPCLRSCPPKFLLDRRLRVVVLWNSPDDQAEWNMAGIERFTAAYAPEDSVYEKLLDGSTLR